MEFFFFWKRRMHTGHPSAKRDNLVQLGERIVTELLASKKCLRAWIQTSSRYQHIGHIVLERFMRHWLSRSNLRLCEPASIAKRWSSLKLIVSVMSAAQVFRRCGESTYLSWHRNLLKTAQWASFLPCIFLASTLLLRAFECQRTNVSTAPLSDCRSQFKLSKWFVEQRLYDKQKLLGVWCTIVLRVHGIAIIPWEGNSHAVFAAAFQCVGVFQLLQSEVIVCY